MTSDATMYSCGCIMAHRDIKKGEEILCHKVNVLCPAHWREQNPINMELRDCGVVCD